MGYGLLADGVVVVHGLFIVFAVLGGFLVVWKPWVAYAHVPAMAWAAYIEFAGGICPLTPLENTFRRLGGEAGYTGGFIEQYITPMIYPGGLTRGTQIVLGIVVIGVNLLAYGLLWRKLRRGHAARG